MVCFQSRQFIAELYFPEIKFCLLGTDEQVPANTSTSMEETENKGTGNRSKENGYLENPVQNSGLEDVMVR